MSPPPRGLVVVRGDPTETAQAAREAVGTDQVLWVSDHEGTAPTAVRRLLGRTYSAVVLDLHAGFDPDLLGRAHGLIAAGGALVLRMPVEPVASARLVVFPYSAEDVGTRMWARLERAIERVPPEPYRPDHRFTGTAEQDTVVAAIRSRLDVEAPARIALLADRGRGKSAALGRAAAGLAATVTASDPAQAEEVLRFAPDARFVEPLELIRSPVRGPLLVDEAASLAVPLLRAILAAHPDSAVAFASTVHGYEGHGRGFSLRFLPSVPRLERFSLTRPIRWAEGDPLEQFVHDVLLLDADVPVLSEPPGSAQIGPIPRDQLTGSMVRNVFGLLVAAHYRTTPADLQRVLDAPNLLLHGVMEGGTPIAVGLLAREGGLPAELAGALARGERRMRGHALAETLAVHSGRPDAAQWTLMRSVRTTTHPDRRRRGLARALVEHIHASHSPDLFGTVFGATPALLAFRSSQGYRPVRLGVARNSRSGEPSVVMVRPCSPRAHGLVADLTAALARDLPLQLTLMAIDGLAIDPALRAALLDDLPNPAPLDDDAALAGARAFAFGPRPYDVAVTAITAWLDSADLTVLTNAERTLILARVVHRHAWTQLAADRQMSIPAVMRALRRAFRRVVPPTESEGSA